MQEDLISFETAKLAKEKGFDISTHSYYFEDNKFKENSIKGTNGYYGDEYEFNLSEFNENWNDKWLTKKDGDRCFGCSKQQGYLETFSAPTQSLLQKWLREVHSIHIEVLPRYQPKKLNTEEVLYSWAISCKPFDKYDGHNDVLNHWIGIHNGAPYIEDIFYHVVKTYEEALEFGLQESLKLIK